MLIRCSSGYTLQAFTDLLWKGCEVYNLGTGKGTSVLELLRWPPRITLGRLLPHARGLGFKPRRGGFPSGAKKEWGLSSKTKVRVLHTAQLDVTTGKAGSSGTGVATSSAINTSRPKTKWKGLVKTEKNRPEKRVHPEPELPQVRLSIQAVRKQNGRDWSKLRKTVNVTRLRFRDTPAFFALIFLFRGYLLLPRHFVVPIRDPFPKSTEFSADDYDVLVAHPAPFRKFPEPFLCLIGTSRNYTLDEDTYLTFLRDDGTGGNKALDSTVGRVVPLLPVAPACAKSELEANVERLFDEGGSADQEDSAAGGGQDVGTGLVTGVKIIVAEDVTVEK
nr:hypothetical protein [Tanacetum cinerariifolium]